MKAAVWTAPGTMELQQLPAPDAGPSEALIRVTGAGVCGSDLHVWKGATPDRKPPLILGHETTGRIVLLAEADGLHQGDTVAIYPVLGCETCSYCQRGREALCRHKKPRGIYAAGGFAEFTRAPLRNLYPIKLGRPEFGALVEPLATAIRFVNSAINDHGPAAIFGLGPIGLMILQVAKLRGFSRFAAVEGNPYRADTAKENGVELVLDPSDPNLQSQLEEFFGEDGCSLVWNTAGVTAARQLSLKIVKSEGLVVEIGLSHPITPVDFDELIRREIRLTPSYAYSRAEFAEAVKLVEQGNLALDDFVSQAPLENIQHVFEDLHKPDTQNVKVILRP